ncbi:MAG: hypothetical protein Q4A75_07470 [Peptostreptococcaceae bacterium]|nr:hypothetical protein [Peptostreptococcaceae bacterium]
MIYKRYCVSRRSGSLTYIKIQRPSLKATIDRHRPDVGTLPGIKVGTATGKIDLTAKDRCGSISNVTMP